MIDVVIYRKFRVSCGIKQGEFIMKKNFKPNTWLYPQPVLVIASYGADGTVDGMVAAWGGIYDTNQVGFMLDHTHKTVANLLEKKAFTVSMATVSTMAESDYLGIVSGNRVPDKVRAPDFMW